MISEHNLSTQKQKNIRRDKGFYEDQRACDRDEGKLFKKTSGPSFCSKIFFVINSHLLTSTPLTSNSP